MKKYSIEELKTYHSHYLNDNIVCHIENEGQYNKLKDCDLPLTAYRESYNYYLCSGPGCAMNPYYTTIEFSQIQFPDEMEKKIIGYQAPMDLFKHHTNGSISKGSIYKPLSSGLVTMYAVNSNSVYNLPAELVETWEPVYEEEFKIGDIVYWSGNNPTFGKIISKCNSFEDSFKLDVYGNTDRYNSCIKNHLRFATEEEIKEYKKRNELPTIGGYKAVVTITPNIKTIKFGCVELTVEMLQAYKYLLESEAGATISVNNDDTVITVDFINKLLKHLQ